MKKIIAILFIIIGIMLLSVPYLSNKVMEQKINAQNELLNSLTVQELEKNENLDAEYDYSSVRDVDLNSVFLGNQPILR